jgi:hypothetical protein
MNMQAAKLDTHLTMHVDMFYLYYSKHINGFYILYVMHIDRFYIRYTVYVDTFFALFNDFDRLCIYIYIYIV